jgi:hypothetical protein
MLIIFLDLKNLVVGENMKMVKQKFKWVAYTTNQTHKRKKSEKQKKSNIEDSEVSFLASFSCL